MDKNITNPSEDQGNVIVMFDSNHYNEKINELTDLHLYRIISRDPTQKILTKTNQLVRQFSIPTDTKKDL